jgi:hypothetical protein
MPQGLQVWDAAGNVAIDTTSSVGTIVGSVAYGNTNGSATISEFSLGRPVWFVLPGTGGSSVYQPNITVSGNTLSWTWTISGSASNPPGVIAYGFY